MFLFICKANVGRSQIAEWFMKNFWINAISCASFEARKNDYKNSPDIEISEILKNEFWINIFKQQIFYPEDVLSKISSVKKIVFFFNPKKELINPDKDILINWITFWDFLDKNKINYEIVEVRDPFERGLKEKKRVIGEIYKIVRKLKDEYGK